MVRIKLEKICISEDGTQICKNQGMNTCRGCGIFSGQRFKGATKRPVLFKGMDIPEALKKLITGV